MHFKFDHDFDIDAKDFWELFFSDDFNEDMFKELRMRERKVLEDKVDGDTRRRRVYFVPSNDVPGFLKKIIGGDLSYTEHNDFDARKSAMDVRIEPSLMRDKFDMRGVYSVTSTGPGKCRRTFEGDVKVSIFMVGGQVEKHTVGEMKESYEVAARVTRKWIEKRKAAAGSAQ